MILFYSEYTILQGIANLENKCQSHHVNKTTKNLNTQKLVIYKHDFSISKMELNAV